jgi:hypothetical protein
VLDLGVYLVATFFAAMGLYALSRPADLLTGFGVSVESVEGRNEVRAVYGGFGLAVAAALVLAGGWPVPARNGVLLAVAIALAGMAAGRVVGVAVERPSRFYPVWFWFCAEMVMAVILSAAALTGP